MHNQLLKLIDQNVMLPDLERALCRQYFEPVLVSKNRILEGEGKIPSYLYFVVSGFVRLFHYNGKGEEVTTHINCPPGFITSYVSFANGCRSDENLECITDCELLRITKRDLDLLVQQSPAFKDFSILVFQQALSYNENRAKELATQSAEQRYLKLMDEYPQIIHNVPMQYIASFLGMNPKSLSRIRRQIMMGIRMKSSYE
ncbi:Crp/Fnr family transcriptional regulator [Sphingobacterium tabacisoli]|uniref:Crp/Fnr family transcriptional regulator n=1 Tax=Sphingobacterium tabacisoli TaxID=2044855 RepID=A0ABW5L1S2_9SPHI|nr:Crp/Fnr family transcriptional regulator [Sphingobacterium tabacisoli]